MTTMLLLFVLSVCGTAQPMWFHGELICEDTLRDVAP